MIHQTTIFVLASGALRIFARPVFEFFYHQIAHRVIHASGHRVGIIGRAFKWCKWLPDSLW